MMDVLKSFLMIFPEWLAAILVAVGAVVTALGLVRLGYGLFVAKTVYKWIVNAEEKFGSGMGAEKKAHVIAVLRGYTPDWLDWAINEKTLDWIVQMVFNVTKKTTWKRNPQKPPRRWPTSVTWGRARTAARSKQCWNLSSSIGWNGFSALLLAA